jgi:hypothetical protein
VRFGNYTAICLGPKPSGPADIPCKKPLLYDLASDPGQQQNVADAHAAAVAQARKLMAQQHTRGGYCGAA